MNTTNHVVKFIHIGPGCKHQPEGKITNEPDVRILLKGAKSDLDSGRHNDAIQKLDLYLASMQGSQEALRLRAYAFRQTGNFEAALEDLNLLIKLGWNSPELHLCLAEVYCALQLKLQARDELHQALRAPGLTIPDCIVIASAFWEIEEFEAAVKLIKSAIAAEERKHVQEGAQELPGSSRLVQEFRALIPSGLLLKIAAG